MAESAVYSVCFQFYGFRAFHIPFPCPICLFSPNSYLPMSGWQNALRNTSTILKRINMAELSNANILLLMSAEGRVTHRYLKMGWVALGVSPSALSWPTRRSRAVCGSVCEAAVRGVSEKFSNVLPPHIPWHIFVTRFPPLPYNKNKILQDDIV